MRLSVVLFVVSFSVVVVVCVCFLWLLVVVVVAGFVCLSVVARLVVCLLVAVVV